MKQTLFRILLILCLAACGLSTTALAEKPDPVVKIGDTSYTTFAQALTAANGMTGDVTVEIYGEVEFTDGMELKGSYSTITFNGAAGGAKITIKQTAGGDYLEAHGKTVEFRNLILAKVNPAWNGNSGHMGNYFSVQGGTVTYTHCTFLNGACTSGGTATYNNCTFQNSNEYGLWVYDDALVTVNGGTIDSKKGIKVYSEDETTVTSTLTVQNATFTGSITAKPAVAIGYAERITLLGNTYNNTTGVLELDSGSDADCEGVTFVAKDAEGNDISDTLTAVDRGNGNARCGVLLVKADDGATYIYTTVTTAEVDAEEGDTVILLYGTDETVKLPSGVILDKKGYTADNVTEAKPVAQIKETGKEYYSIQDAVNAAESRQTVVVIENHELDCNISSDVDPDDDNALYPVAVLVANKEITLDLNDKILNVKVNSNKKLYGIFAVDKNGILRIIDSGTDHKGAVNVTAETYLYSMFFAYNPNTKLVVDGGNFSLDKTWSNQLIYAQRSDLVYINGGSFYLGNLGTTNTTGNGNPWIFNAKYNDANYITVTGGTFNADVNHQYWEYEVFVPKTRALKSNHDGTWSVVDSVAYVEEHSRKYPNNSTGAFYIRETGCASLNDAVASANEYSDEGVSADKTNTIILLADCPVGNALTISDNIVLKIDGKNIVWIGNDEVPIIVEEDASISYFEPTRTGYDFGGWYKDANCTVGYTLSDGETTINGPIQLYAKWTINRCTVNFNSNGGSAIDPITLDHGTFVATPEAPTKSGYTFVGWYTDEALTTEYDFTQAVIEDITLYAKWQKKSSPSYSIDLSQAENGSVQVSPSRAKAGRLITLTVTPDEGYELDSITVTDKNGNAIDVTDKGDGTYTFKMPKSKATVEASFAEVEPPVEPGHDNCAYDRFTDLEPDAWYHDAVDFVLNEGIMTGTGETTFEPQVTLNRAMMVQILYNMEGRPAAGEASFDDVASGDWFAPAVAWAAANGIVNGASETAYAPLNDLTREQMTAILWRYAQHKGMDVSAGEDTNILSYNDAQQVSEYAIPAMQWAVGDGVINGKPGALLDPTGTAKRCEVAQVMLNFCQIAAE